jgi:hypothetical protein
MFLTRSLLWRYRKRSILLQPGAWLQQIVACCIHGIRNQFGPDEYYLHKILIDQH